ncbi:hypothetical protein PsYK624_131300 [Phanerochaete sordida]|uniref:Uncharacterized protein n=1 Tax=Phanerochaete sordida TaxID=48140 RepID=A0A9P3GK01_9APHY|nr:hypothetical protein PsYK624_131300 [Phanerochaete sordida]
MLASNIDELPLRYTPVLQRSVITLVGDFGQADQYVVGFHGAPPEPCYSVRVIVHADVDKTRRALLRSPPAHRAGTPTTRRPRPHAKIPMCKSAACRRGAKLLGGARASLNLRAAQPRPGARCTASRHVCSGNPSQYRSSTSLALL